MDENDNDRGFHIVVVVGVILLALVIGMAAWLAGCGR